MVVSKKWKLVIFFSTLIFMIFTFLLPYEEIHKKGCVEKNFLFEYFVITDYKTLYFAFFILILFISPLIFLLESFEVKRKPNILFRIFFIIQGTTILYLVLIIWFNMYFSFGRFIHTNHLNTYLILFVPSLTGLLSILYAIPYFDRFKILSKS
jgi:hypothetical protein